ncbi:hypothetical protein ASZ90_011811 [hydrocarbon metagenome]|uniref:Uncharacterized protein n=1 Tax=hydrocarbon metagenome TaxID=938273 RepID=A0A0W8FCA3_9ZZZZ
MKWVIDASIFVASARSVEPDYWIYSSLAREYSPNATDAPVD